MTTDAQFVDMRGRRVDFAINQGADFQFTITFADTVDMSGSAFEIVVQKNDGTDVETAELGDGVTLVGRVATVLFTNAQTLIWPDGITLNYEARWSSTAYLKRILSYGTISVQKKLVKDA